MHVDERLEPVLLAGIELPVDRTLLVRLAVVGEEFLKEIRANDLARRPLPSESVSDESQVLLQGFVAVHDAHEFDELPDDIVVEVFIIRYRKHVVGIGHERDVGGIGHLRQIIFNGLPGIGEHQAFNVEGEPTEHAANSVADERYDDIALGLNVLVAFERLGDLALAIEDSRHRYVFILDLDGDLAHHVVDLGEDAVELLLVGLELIPSRVNLGFVSLVLIRDESSHLRRLSKIPKKYENILQYVGFCTNSYLKR